MTALPLYCTGCHTVEVDIGVMYCPTCELLRHVFERSKFDIGMEWAAPGDNQEDVWKLFFHDRDCGEMIFRGPEAEKEAWEAWDRFAPSYNVNLFRQVRMKERPA